MIFNPWAIALGTSPAQGGERSVLDPEQEKFSATERGTAGWRLEEMAAEFWMWSCIVSGPCQGTIL